MLRSNGNLVLLGDVVRECKKRIEGWSSVDNIKLRVRCVCGLSKKGSGFEILKIGDRVYVRNRFLDLEEEKESKEKIEKVERLELEKYNKYGDSLD